MFCACKAADLGGLGGVWKLKNPAYNQNKSLEWETIDDGNLRSISGTGQLILSARFHLLATLCIPEGNVSHRGCYDGPNGVRKILETVLTGMRILTISETTTPLI